MNNNILCGIKTTIDKSNLKQMLNFNEFDSNNTNELNEEFLDINNFLVILNDIDNCLYREDAIKIKSEINKKLNKIQDFTINEIINNKPKKKINFYVKYLIIKKCPHCGVQCTGTCATNYTICGYNDEEFGYDQNCCGKDWCFKCGKKLCKEWNDNELFMFGNRNHNKTCCKLYAEANNMDYDNEFCMCNNEYVNRNINI